MESVLEIRPTRARTCGEAARRCGRCARQVRDIADRKGLLIGWRARTARALGGPADPAAPRYRDLVDALRFVARQEMIFGCTCTSGSMTANKAIHVANGMRVHVPILLALSASSPFWRGDDTAWRRCACRLPRVPARRHPALDEELGDFERAHRLHGRGRA